MLWSNPYKHYIKFQSIFTSGIVGSCNHVSDTNKLLCPYFVAKSHVYSQCKISTRIMKMIRKSPNQNSCSSLKNGPPIYPFQQQIVNLAMRYGFMTCAQVIMVVNMLQRTVVVNVVLTHKELWLQMQFKLQDFTSSCLIKRQASSNACLVQKLKLAPSSSKVPSNSRKQGPCATRTKTRTTTAQSHQSFVSLP